MLLSVDYQYFTMHFVSNPLPEQDFSTICKKYVDKGG